MKKLALVLLLTLAGSVSAQAYMILAKRGGGGPPPTGGPSCIVSGTVTITGVAICN